MKNIIICGLKGTGKTTLSKLIAQKYGYKYISDYEIKEDIKSFAANKEGYVMDLCYSLFPKDCVELSNSLVYFLGFASIDEKLLYFLMNQKNEGVGTKQIEEMKRASLLFFEECKCFNLPFFDVTMDREKVFNEIIIDIEKNKTKF